VEEVLADPEIKDDIKDRIRLVQRVRAFGENHMGLRPSRGYGTFIEIQGDAVAYVVSACPKERLAPFLWRFPIVGEFPYKGFFRRAEAEMEKAEMEAKGYDAHLSAASAFSALGWFSDPLYSSMLRMEPIDLIYTIFHEMVHGTVFFPDQVDFNEQVATLIGWEGVLAFTSSEHGKDSPESKRVRDAIEDEKQVARFLSWAYDRLVDYYSRPIAVSQKIAGRDGVFEEIRNGAISLLPELRTPRYGRLPAISWNNATLMAFWRYRYDTGPLGSLYEREGRDLQYLIQILKKWLETGWNPKELLEKGSPALPPPRTSPS
jgi:predicted aminopeptidase